MTVPSYGAPGYQPPAPRSRPTTVTVASYLLYFVAAIEVINALLVFSTYGKINDAIQGAFAGTEVEGTEGFVAGIYVAAGAINLIIGAAFAVLGFLDGRGKNPARIVTWVVGGLSLCCLGAGLGGSGFTSAMDTSTDGTGPSQDEVERRINDALPTWYDPTTTALAALGLLAILAVVILLALPASNAFFRKRVAGGEWGPNVPYPQYPGGPYPGAQQPSPYPSAPGQPGQPYPGAPQPGYGQAPYPGGQQYPAYPGHQGQPGQPAPGLPPYPGQSSPPSDPYAAPPASDPYGPPASLPPASDPYAPASDPYAPPPTGSPSGDQPRPSSGEQNRPPADPTADRDEPPRPPA